MSSDPALRYTERLWPSPWLLASLLLLLPAVTLTVTPLSSALAVPIAILVYLLITGAFLLMTPSIVVTAETLRAGHAQIPLSALGEIEVLGSTALRRTIGPEADARAFLLVRGHIHRGIRIEVTDPKDPTPYWVITSRKAEQLAKALQEGIAALEHRAN